MACRVVVEYRPQGNKLVGDLDGALRKFKTAVKKAGIIEKCREKESFMSNREKRIEKQKRNRKFRKK